MISLTQAKYACPYMSKCPDIKSLNLGPNPKGVDYQGLVEQFDEVCTRPNARCLIKENFELQEAPR